MTTIAGVGTSHHHNPNVAGREAADQALENAGIVKPDIVFMLASIGYDQRSLLLIEDHDWMPYAISLALVFEVPSYMKDEEYVVRGVPAVRMADGSIVVQTEVKEGTSVWLSSRDKEKITTGFDRMAEQIKHQRGVRNPNSSSSLSA